jgi:tetratricopeptide (TPR) repeat protein
VLAAEELSHELSASQMVDVISPLSSRRLAGRAILPEEIGKRLGADYLILVEFQERGTTGQLNVELVEARTNVMKWQQRTDLSSLATAHITAATERIAHECLAALFVAQLAHASSAPLASLDSYKLLFSAIALMDRWTRTSFHRAHEHLAILRQRAPLHHWPNAWLSAWHIRSISQGWSADPIRDGKAAIEHARMALDSNASCSLAIAMEGWANVYGSRRLDLAIERMQFAVEVNHSDSLAWLLKGITHAFIDQPAQAVEAVERALKLSPIDPRRSYYEALAAGAFAATDDHARTIELAQSSLRANRLHASPLRALAAAQWYSGREAEARHTVQRLIEIEPKFTVDRYLRQHPAADSRYGRRIADALRSAGAP